MGLLNGSYTVRIEYRRQNGRWALVGEHIDGEIRNRNPQALARVTAVDLPMACSARRKDSPEIRRHKEDAVPRKHVGLLMKTLVELGLYPRSMHEETPGEAGQEGEEYRAFIVVEEISPPYLHLG